MKSCVPNTFIISLFSIILLVGCTDSDPDDIWTEKHDINTTDPENADTDDPIVADDEKDTSEDLCPDEEQCEDAPQLKMGKPFFREDERIVVNYFNLPGNLSDGVGLFDSKATLESPLQYDNTSGFSAGALNFDPLPRGSYSALLFIGGSTIPVHEIDFEVKQRDTPDNCPDDPGKTDPGTCGCGQSDADDDGDGAPDCLD